MRLSISQILIVGGRLKMAHNGLQIAEGGELEVQILNIAQMIIVVQMFNKPLMPCFCKTLVRRMWRLVKR